MVPLTIDLGFCVRQGNNTLWPCVDVIFNQQTMITNLILNLAGSVDDPSANMQWVHLDTSEFDSDSKKHCLKVYEKNIASADKTLGDFGFQIRSIRINGVIMEQFLRPSQVVNPVLEQSYIDEFIRPQQRTHEIKPYRNGLAHIEQGDTANYVNSPGGWFEFNFETPLYQWIVANNFGAMHRWLIDSINDR